ncbi:uncharacterized protein LOC135835380 isoform X2 [Planococcus citri]|uniref:uncharacterized protein LOC135835380 isoform X2 n=1 Tax=Planococcus citri TaxID=170843 RepID=UPI0031F93F72
MSTTTIKKCANRKFCTLPEDYPFKNVKCRSTLIGKPADFPKLIKYVDENIIGRNVTFLGPFGRRKVVYCDYTASGRSLHFIEDYILKEVLPLYANTHTSSNVTALQSSLYRQEARDIIRSAVHASESDAVVFAGNGCTDALQKLIHALDLERAPVVFVGSNEHHSVLLPWREIGAKVIRIAETKEGFLDLIDLENKLQKEKQLLLNGNSHVQFIGCFSATSNITGILADDIATTVLLHQYGALSFWDYATAAPYVPLDMNPLLPGNDKGVHKDAIFFSGHKFVGGVQTPGVLVAKKQLFKSEMLDRSADGAVLINSKENQRYFQNIEVREESGNTGSIVDSIRMGLAVHLKQTLGPPNIMLREQKITKTVLSFLRTIPEIILLGNGSRSVKRLPIFSFVVRHPRGVFLHHNFICSVLNDVFGIQARGGCACAGPYAHDLLGIDDKLASAYEEVLSEDETNKNRVQSPEEQHSCFEMLRPGFTRISLPYFMSDAEVTFVLEAVKMVATEGWKLLPQYVLYPEMGEWKHRTNLVFRERKWLNSVRFIDGKMTANERKISGQSPFPQDPSDCLHMARNIFNKARKMAHRYPLVDQRVMFDEKADELRWFMLPSEAQDLLLGNCQNVKTKVPFSPGEYCGTRNNSISEDSTDSATPLVPCSISPSLDFGSNSYYTRHNSLTSFDSSPLKRSSSFFAEKSCSDCGCLSPFHSKINREASPMSRTRCYSLESNSASPPNRLLSSVEINGHCSCGSQTDISDAESVSKADFSDFSDMGITTLFPTTENENIKAYVKGVTEELASEIKTEIREVINTVDNVLSESMENLDVNGMSYDKRFNTDFRRTSSIPMLIKPATTNHYTKPVHSYSDSATYCNQPMFNYGMENSRPNSAGLRKRLYSQEGKSCPETTADMSDQVAVYLAELTSEMVTEMKSELREMVNAVDEIISPSVNDKNTYSGFDSSNSRNRTVSVTLQEEWEDSDDSHSQNEGSYKSCKTDALEEMKVIKNNNSDAQSEETKSLTKSDSSSDSGVAEVCPKESPSKVSKRKISVIARESRSSPDVKEYIKEAEIELKIENNEEEEKKEKPFCIDQRKRSFESVALQPKWHCPPKTVWKPTVEAIREFDMIREGDRILICLSGGKDSLSLLHTLHQYQYYSQSYGVTFTFGAVTVDPGSPAYDPRPLIPYMHALGVHYLYEEHKLLENLDETKCTSLCGFCNRLKRSHLYKAARENNYNVLALGQHLDDSAESLLMSTFHDGRLKSMKAHYYIRNENTKVELENESCLAIGGFFGNCSII